MFLRLTIPLIALMLLPTASASDAPHEPDPLAIVRILDPDHVQPVATVGGHGLDIVPLCPGAPPLQPGAHALGTPGAACFHVLHVGLADHDSIIFRSWSTSAFTTVLGGGGSGPVCDPVGVSILPEGGPPVFVDPDEGCINAIIDEVLG